MDILDLFAAFPGRAFTMAEIMRATDINIASCHAVLSALTRRGYLARNGKNYALGHALIIVGQAAAQTQALAGYAQAAAHALNKELGVAVMLSSLTADDILTLTSLPNPAGRLVGLRAGQRMPLIPPVGTQFLGWADENEIAAWIARGTPADADTPRAWRRALARVRARGFLLTLRSPATSDFSTLMKLMAAGTQPLEYKTQTSGAVSDYGWMLEHPETIDPRGLYSVGYIAAPIFDTKGRAVLSLGLGGFAEPLSGAQVELLANRLMATCLRVTQEARAP